jgi:hypothetical protein
LEVFMPTRSTLAASLICLALVSAGSLAESTTSEQRAKQLKSAPASAGVKADRQGNRASHPGVQRWDALDPRTIERQQKRRAIEAPSFPPERQ